MAESALGMRKTLPLASFVSIQLDKNQSDEGVGNEAHSTFRVISQIMCIHKWGRKCSWTASQKYPRLDEATSTRPISSGVLEEEEKREELKPVPDA